jgi:tetratricopeptide (TPR) repeat protein
MVSFRVFAGLLLSLAVCAAARADEPPRPSRAPTAVEVVAHRSALMKHPDAVHAVQIGVDAMVDDDCEAAIVQFDKALAIDPKNFDAYIHRSQCESRLGDLGKALADAEAGVQNAAWLDEAYETRAMVLAARGDLGGALLDCQTAYQIPRNRNERLADCRGYVEFAQGRYAQAALHLQYVENEEEDRHRALFLYFTTRRLGRDGEIELLKHTDPSSLQGVLSDVVEMIKGRLSEDSVLERAVSEPDRCAVEFYVGEWDLLQNQADLANQRLQRAAACNAGYKTALAARAELKRVGTGR